MTGSDANPAGYGCLGTCAHEHYDCAALKDSVKAGLKPAVPDAGFAAGLAKQPPLPEGCDF